MMTTLNNKYQIINNKLHHGSAIILAIVLTTLLAIIAVMFLLSSRVDMLGTSAIADNENLNLAVDTVVAKISQVLAADVPGPGIDPNKYYDYPDANNVWLASLEPNNSRLWPHITDINNQLGFLAYNLAPQIKDDYQQDSEIGDSSSSFIFPADADGDGVSDSAWIKLPGITSSRGKPIYAAVRIIDNSGMLNVNTGYKFDVNISDGSSQLDVNLVALAGRPAYTSGEDTALLNARNPLGKSTYSENVIWRYDKADGNFTPFDISDELEMRNRFVLNHKDIDTRLEDWGGEFRNAVESTPYSSVAKWFLSAYDSGVLDPNYSYRHIATTYNYDRIIDPNGGKMLNINKSPVAEPNNTRDTIAAALMAGGVLPANANALGAQITANLIDYVDGPDYSPSDPIYDPNNNVTVVYDETTSPSTPYFGFESPCIYISELAQNFFQPDANDPNIILGSYAVELYKPYNVIPSPGEWKLIIIDPNFSFNIDILWTSSGPFYAFVNDDFNLVTINTAEYAAQNPIPLNGAIGVRPDIVLFWPKVSTAVSYNIYFGTNDQEVFNGSPADPNVFMGNVLADTNSFDPPGLLADNTTFYWRIDSLSPFGVTRGQFWRFTVSDVNALPTPIKFDKTSTILLQRWVSDVGWITVDAVELFRADINSPFWLKPVPGDANNPLVKASTHSFQRDIFPNKPIRRLWDLNFGFINSPTIGKGNDFVGDAPQVQANPANKPFTNVGEFGQLFYNSTCRFEYGGIVFADLPNYGVTESQMRINLTLPAYQQVFKYLTVMDPTTHTGDPNETRIKGRININTAPWFVLAQLPWVSEHPQTNYALARAIEYYRDFRGGYKNIGELMLDANNSDNNIGYYLGQSSVPSVLMTPPDGLGDAYEQRDAIFARISNLITVRSDVFTAYILVRIGPDGPQKRVVAILDRSDIYPNPDYNPVTNPIPYIGKIKTIAVQSVPDPR